MRKYVADFETTTKAPTRVWAFGISEIGNIDNFEYGNNIKDFFKWCKKENKEIYFHNLKFDASFIIHYLMTNGFEYSEVKRDNTFNTTISNMGQFYRVEIIFKKMKKKYKKVVIYDSLKKLPFTVAKIAKDFGLPIQKGEIDYDKERPEGYEPDNKEVSYLKNDVQIVATALGIQFEQGLTKMTIGSDALHNYKVTMGGEEEFKRYFPVLPLDVDEVIRDAYKGGFTFLSKRYAHLDMLKGVVFDVNSLYPSVMRYRELPYGMPVKFDGQYEKDELFPLYIQQIECTFKLKKDMLPTIQLKNNFRFVSTEYIEDSGLEPVPLMLTNIDLELFFEHYDVDEDTLEYIDGYKFKSYVGFFNDYIDYWTHIKETSPKGSALYFISKLMLNSLYGKFGKNPDVTGKYPILNDDNTLSYKLMEEKLSDPVYIPMATFITSWARYTTITTAQKVYSRFIYADTDSIHLEGVEMPSIEIDDRKLGKWKYEGSFSRARFIRAKTYIEEMDGVLHVTCAGMPDNVKEKVTWDNFKRGLVLDGKLSPKQVDGGIILENTTFTLT